MLLGYVQRKLNAVEGPEVRYATSGDVNIAYSMVGGGPFDLVFVGGWVVSNLVVAWEGSPRDFFEKIGSSRGDGELGAFARKPECDGASDTAGGAGDERGAACELEIHLSSIENLRVYQGNHSYDRARAPMRAIEHTGAAL